MAKTNEVSIWMKNKSECITLTNDRAKSCVFVEATDGFYLCRESDVDALCEEIKSRLRSMEQTDWAMGHL